MISPVGTLDPAPVTADQAVIDRRGHDGLEQHLDEFQAKARAASRRILDAERAGQGTVLASPAFERIAHPSTDAEGRRTPVLRFGDPWVMALVGAPCQTLLAQPASPAKTSAS